MGWLLAACAREPARPPPAPAPEPTGAPAAKDTATPPGSSPTDTTPAPEDTTTSRHTATPGHTAPPPAPPRWFAYVGAADGRISVFSVDPGTAALAPVGAWEAGQEPSFLAFAPDRRFLVAVDERGDALTSLAVDPATGGLALLDRTSSGGHGPAHVAVDATGTVALAANYGSGDVTLVRLEPDGRFGPTLTRLATGAHAHQAAIDPSDRFVFVPNLGADGVSQLLLDPAAGTLVPNAVPTVGAAPGSGPRHLAFAPAAPFAYLVHELDDTVTALSFDAANGRLAPLQTLSTLPAGVDAEGAPAAEVLVSADGRWVYATNRGHDSIVQYAVAADGRLTLVGHTPTGGSWPRHASLSPDGAWLFVAHQRSDTVVTFHLDPATGVPTARATTPILGAPAFVGVIELP